MNEERVYDRGWCLVSGGIIEALREESVSSCLRCWGVREDGLGKLTIKYVDPHLSTSRERDIDRTRPLDGRASPSEEYVKKPQWK